METKLLIQSGQVMCQFESDNNEVIRFLSEQEFPQMHIPGYQCTVMHNGNVEESVTPQIFIKHSGHKEETANDKGIFPLVTNKGLYCDIVVNQPNLAELTYCLLPPIERVRQEYYSEYSVHGAAITNGDVGIVLLGQSGSGKTLLSRFFMEHGWMYIADERTILRGNHVLDGNRVSKSKDGSFYRSPKPHQTRISLLMYPKVTFGSKFIMSRFDLFDASLKIFAETSMIIRGIGVRLNDIAFGDLDTQEIADQRLAWAKKLVNDIPIYYAEGNPDRIIEETEKVLRQF